MQQLAPDKMSASNIKVKEDMQRGSAAMSFDEREKEMEKDLASIALLRTKISRAISEMDDTKESLLSLGEQSVAAVGFRVSVGPDSPERIRLRKLLGQLMREQMRFARKYDIGDR